MRHQAASVVWASLGVERPDTWQINCWYRILHAHFTRTPTPVSVYRFPTICSEAVCPHTAYQIVVARWRRRLSAQYWARLLRKVLGRYQYHPILASIGQYPIPQYRYRSNPNYDVFQYNITGQTKVYWKECTTQNASTANLLHLQKLIIRTKHKHDLDGSFMPI